jgi:hypothetical protein
MIEKHVTKYLKEKRKISKSIHITVLTSKPSFIASSLAASTASAVLTCKLHNSNQLSRLKRISTKSACIDKILKLALQSTDLHNLINQLNI